MRERARLIPTGSQAPGPTLACRSIESPSISRARKRRLRWTSSHALAHSRRLDAASRARRRRWSRQTPKRLFARHPLDAAREGEAALARYAAAAVVVAAMSSPANANNASKSRVLTRKTSIENSPKGGGNAVEVKSEERRGKPVDLVVDADKVAAPCNASKPSQAAMAVPGQHQPRERNEEGEEKRKESGSADTNGSGSAGRGASEAAMAAMVAPAVVKKEPPQPTSGGAPPKPAKPAATTSNNSKAGAPKAPKFKGTSQYRGVAQHRVTQRWESHVWENKKQIYLGSFATEKVSAPIKRTSERTNGFDSIRFDLIRFDSTNERVKQSGVNHKESPRDPSLCLSPAADPSIDGIRRRAPSNTLTDSDFGSHGSIPNASSPPWRTTR